MDKATTYKHLAALRLTNPLNLLARFGRAYRGDGDTLEAFLQREYGPLLDGGDLEAVARSIEEDAADITAILDGYDESSVTYDDNDDVHCPLCEDGTPCRERFENDAADVSMEADEPYLDVMIWMDTECLSSLTDGITSMAENYRKSLDAAQAVQTLERSWLGNGD